MDVIFIVTHDTGELDYFYNNIFSISMTIQLILHQDFSELEQVEQELHDQY